MSIGENIKKYRGAIKQADFAEKLGVSTVTVSRWENGANIPNSEMLQNIAQVLDIPVEKLLEEQHKPQIKELEERHLKEDYGLMIYQFSDNEILKMPAIPELIPIFKEMVSERLQQIHSKEKIS